MSLADVQRVIQKSLSDEAFRSLISERPYDALDGYDLEPDEQGALIAGSDADLASMGVEPQQARAYSDLFKISRGGGG